MRSTKCIAFICLLCSLFFVGFEITVLKSKNIATKTIPCTFSTPSVFFLHGYNSANASETKILNTATTPLPTSLGHGLILSHAKTKLPTTTAMQLTLNHDRENPKLFRILMYGFWRRKGRFGEWPSTMDARLQRNCECPCYVENNFTKVHLSNVVVINGLNVNGNWLKRICADSLTDQVRILFMNEAPANFNSEYWEAFKNCFHFLSTYKLSSAAPHPHGRFQRLVEAKTETGQSDVEVQKKTSPIAWAVSNCKTNSRREEYVKNLQNYISVDVYGRCGKLQCPKDNSTLCYKMFAQKYFFYLSFENSLCEDYITEKVFQILKLDLVPLVMGGANYSAHLPPNSFINVLDFKSPENLASYLNIVMNNNTLYNSFFIWKRYYRLIPKPSYPCEICKFVSEHWATTRKSTYIPSVQTLWNTSQCIIPQW